jgi:hypothetical protein
MITNVVTSQNWKRKRKISTQKFVKTSAQIFSVCACMIIEQQNLQDILENEMLQVIFWIPAGYHQGKMESNC